MFLAELWVYKRSERTTSKCATSIYSFLQYSHRLTVFNVDVIDWTSGQDLNKQKTEKSKKKFDAAKIDSLRQFPICRLAYCYAVFSLNESNDHSTHYHRI